MGIAAAILVALGIVALIYGAMQKFKSGRLAKAPFVKTGEAASRGEAVAGDRGAISVEGAVQAPQPLLSPASGTPCLYYELKVIGSWKDGDSEESKEYLNEKQAASFALDDGSGPVTIVAGEGGDFELQKTFDETKKEGFFADLKSAVGKGEPIVFGRYHFQNPMLSKANKFQCIEHVLPLAPQLFAVGKVQAAANGNAVGSPSWTSLILSQKTRDQVVAGTAKTASYALIGGAAASGVGAVLGLVSQLIA